MTSVYKTVWITLVGFIWFILGQISIALQPPVGALKAEPNSSKTSWLAKAFQNEDVKKAVDVFRNGELAVVEKLLEEACRKSPDLPAPKIMLGQLYLEARAAQQAIATFDRMVIEQPNNFQPHLLLGDLALRSARLTDAWLHVKEI
ncbi:MAG: hypothetical protein MUC83_14640, partial [Pirellula sp.]|nr:hypothetical protein [Pirellula sp.]